MNHTRIAAAVVAALAALSLSACSSAPVLGSVTQDGPEHATLTQHAADVVAAQPAPEPEYAPEPEPAAPTRDRAGYLDHVHSESTETRAVPDPQLVELGDTICETLRSGASVYTIVEAGVDSGLSSTTIAALVSGAALYLCPDQIDNVQSQLA